MKNLLLFFIFFYFLDFAIFAKKNKSKINQANTIDKDKEIKINKKDIALYKKTIYFVNKLKESYKFKYLKILREGHNEGLKVTKYIQLKKSILKKQDITTKFNYKEIFLFKTVDSKINLLGDDFVKEKTKIIIQNIGIEKFNIIFEKLNKDEKFKKRFQNQ